MLFNSWNFLLFFPIVTVGYFALPHRFRWAWLLGASCWFYMAFVPVYILILGFTIVIDYWAGIFIENAKGIARKHWLYASLVANIGVLAIFKYYNFLNENLSILLGWASIENSVPYLSILLPIGLSFHTFQAMSYTIEVYRGKQSAEKHFGIYALYVMFYPQLVAGPIERPQNVLHQFHEKHGFDERRIANGLKLMAWGFFKKIVIADHLSTWVNTVYGNLPAYTGISLLVACIAFSFQIYCDFSGYSDIAIGAAQVMGFNLMKNFDRPYFSKSISEFWRRWHISLSTWFRDYLYIPLGGSKTMKWRWYYNLFITFLISGIWHGASWNFVIWGSLHGFFLVFALISAPIRNKIVCKIHLKQYPFIYQLSQTLIVFGLVTVAWVFFRAKTFADAYYVMGNFSTNLWWQLTQLTNRAFLKKNIMFNDSIFVCLSTWASVLLLLAVEWQQRGKSLRSTLAHYPAIIRWVLYYGILLAIILLGSFDNAEQFIYFQF